MITSPPQKIGSFFEASDAKKGASAFHKKGAL